MTDDYVGYNALALQPGVKRLMGRREKSHPILTQLKSWLDKTQF
jgi:hypothetical protein